MGEAATGVNAMSGTRVDIKPLSVNEAWRGRRFKTDKYKTYELEMLLRLPRGIVIPAGPLAVSYEFGLSNIVADWDNPVKPLQDILQKKYGFDDKRIMEAVVRKVKVGKGQEYVQFQFREAA